MSSVPGVSTSPFWSYGRAAYDSLSSLRNYQYQIAPRSPQSTTRTDDVTDQLDTQLTEDVRGASHLSPESVSHKLHANCRLRLTRLTRIICFWSKYADLIVNVNDAVSLSN